MKYIASCSFGKDSLATVILVKEHGEPLDEIVYCEVMFDDHISGEIPEHRRFIYDVAVPKLDGWGIKTVVLRSKNTYVSSFKREIKSGKNAGKIKAWPLCGMCCIQRDCKIPPIEKYKKSLGPDIVQYIGIANDEQERLLRLDGVNRISLLQKYQVTEDMAFQICRDNGLLSPIYDFTTRGAASSAQMPRTGNFGIFETITQTCGKGYLIFRSCQTKLQKSLIVNSALMKLICYSKTKTINFLCFDSRRKCYEGKAG